MRLPLLRARLLGPMDLTFGDRQLPPLESARAEEAFQLYVGELLEGRYDE